MQIGEVAGQMTIGTDGDRKKVNHPTGNCKSQTDPRLPPQAFSARISSTKISSCLRPVFVTTVTLSYDDLIP